MKFFRFSFSFYFKLLNYYLTIYRPCSFYYLYCIPMEAYLDNSKQISSTIYIKVIIDYLSEPPPQWEITCTRY